MAEDGEPKADDLQETAPRPDKPTSPDKPRGGAATAPEAADHAAVEEPAPAVEASGRFQALIRSTFAARAIGSSRETSGDLANVEASGSGVSLRGAYLSHLAETGGSAAAGGEFVGSNVLRAAFVAHADAEALAGRARRAAPAKRRAAAPARRRKAAAKPARPAAAKGAAKKKASAKSPAKKPLVKKKAKPAGKRSASARRAPSAGKKTAARAAPKRRAGPARAAAGRAKQAKGPRR